MVKGQRKVIWNTQGVAQGDRVFRYLKPAIHITFIELHQVSKIVFKLSRGRANERMYKNYCILISISISFKFNKQVLCEQNFSVYTLCAILRCNQSVRKSIILSLYLTIATKLLLNKFNLERRFAKMSKLCA